jgi:hypothetical protein
MHAAHARTAPPWARDAPMVWILLEAESPAAGFLPQAAIFAAACRPKRGNARAFRR